jgi:LysM repeat protein
MFGRHFCAWLVVVVAVMAAPGVASAAEASGGRQVHVVYKGQRLGSIAKRYNVSIEALCQANGIVRRDPIHPGQRLVIPSRNDTRAADEKSRTVSPGAPKVKAETAAVASSKSHSVLTEKANTEKANTVSKTAALDKPTLSRATPDPALAAASAVTPLATFGALSHRVKAGESLSAIAVHHGTNVKTLLRANNLSRDKVIRVGQVLVIPKAAMKGTWWGKFARAPRRAGEMEVFAHTHRWRGKVVVNGKVQPGARAALSGLLGATGSAPPIAERLIQLLSHVSDTFGGRPIRLVSGYRTSSYVKDSRHRHSSAVDFSIPGVPNSAVRDYLLQLGNVGVGYYPNSTFVHLDVRAHSAYWVDYAGPGEAPRKQPRAQRRFARNAGKTPTQTSDARSSSAQRKHERQPNALGAF